MSKLTVKLEKKKDPYPNEEDFLWGQITIQWNSLKLFECEWNLLSFVEWFAEKKKYLKNELFPFDYTHSIAESREKLFDRIDEYDELDEQFKYEDTLIEYFRNHHFHLRGTDTQDFYIGLVPNGRGQISWKETDKYYSHDFEMNNFLEETDLEIKKFLKKIRVEDKIKNFYKDELQDYYSFIGLK